MHDAPLCCNSELIFLLQVGPGEVVSVRYVLSGFVMSIPIMCNPSSLMMSRKQWIIACIGGLLGGATTYIAYTAYTYIPLMDAQTLFNVQAIFVAIIASIFLKEQIGILDITAISVSFTGIILVCQPSFIFGNTSHAVSPSLRLIGTGFGLLCAFCQGTTGVLCRYLKSMKFYVFTFLLSCGGVLFSLVVTLALEEDMPYPTGKQFGQLIAIGILACISKGTLTLAFQYDDATPVTMVQSLEIVFAYFFQWLFFGQRPKYLETIGAVLVMTGITVIVAKKKINEKLSCRRNEEEMQPYIITNVSDQLI